MSQTIFDRVRARSRAPRFMPLEEYLLGCRENPGYYASAAERLLKAIGEPEVVRTIDRTRGDPRLARIFQNRTVKFFRTFEDFYGIEPAIEELCNRLRSASQGLEAKKQIIYLLGPVGSAKSSLAERIKDLMEQEPFYVLAVQDKDKKGSPTGTFTLSPLYESPLGLFPKQEASSMEATYGIPAMHFDGICSPWALKRLRELDGDITKFWVAEMYPSKLRQVGIAKTDPGDENNQDISCLVGKVDVRKLELHPIDDPDAYSYSGALCKASQGLMEFVEMFKAPTKTLHPLLTATQERNFSGTEPIGVMPFSGILMAHSNESEWEAFRTNQRNEAFLDRVQIIKVRYNLRLTEEQRIYEKLLQGSALRSIPVAPFALELLARTVIASRLKPSGKVKSKEHKVRLYDGQDIAKELPNPPTLTDLIEEAGQDEGMTGISTRTAFKIIEEAANAGEELALDPVEILTTTKRTLRRELGSDADKHIEFLDAQAKGWLYTALGDIIRRALLENHDAYAQNRFERYFDMAFIWADRTATTYPDPDTGQTIDKNELDKRLKEVEGPAKIQNGDEFRNQVVYFIQNYKLNHGNAVPPWTVYEPMKDVIKALVERDTMKLLPLISFEPKKDTEESKKHGEFVERMKAFGFTEIQMKRIIPWYMNQSRSS